MWNKQARGERIFQWSRPNNTRYIFLRLCTSSNRSEILQLGFVVHVGDDGDYLTLTRHSSNVCDYTPVWKMCVRIVFFGWRAHRRAVYLVCSVKNNNLFQSLLSYTPRCRCHPDFGRTSRDQNRSTARSPGQGYTTDALQTQPPRRRAPRYCPPTPAAGARGSKTSEQSSSTRRRPGLGRTDARNFRRVSGRGAPFRRPLF